MSNYTRKAKRKNLENNAPRCCGRHMFMNKYGLWQCKRCGKQRFDTGAAVQLDTKAKAENITSEVVDVLEPTTDTIIDVENTIVHAE